MKQAIPLAVLMVAFLTATNTIAQQLPRARITSIFPAGGQQGATMEATIAGGDLEEAKQLFFSHPGIKAVPKKDDNGKGVVNQYAITIAKNVPVGIYDVQVGGGRFGISNVRAFAVGDLPEAKATAGTSADKAMEIKVGTTINGQAVARNYSFFKFTLKKGQRILVECQAPAIDSKMAPVLVIQNAGGLELERNRFGESLDFTADADGDYFTAIHDFTYGGGAEHMYRLTVSQRPYIDFIVPPVGKPGSNAQYTVYGRNLPSGQDSGLMLGGKQLQKKMVTINLPGDAAARVNIDCSTPVGPMGAGFDGVDYRLPSAAGVSNPVRIHFAGDNVLSEAGAANDQPESAQKLPVPCEYVGTFFPRRDRDWVTFNAKKDDVYWLEVVSERLGVPTNPYFRVERVTKNDKGEVKVSTVKEVQESPVNIGGATFNTTSVDPSFRLVVPEDGTYRVLLYDLYNSEAASSLYRFSIHREAPDFRLVAMPEGAVAIANQPVPMPTGFLRRGEVLPLKVMAFRRDGFNEPIALSITGLPDHITASKAVIASGQNSAYLMLKAKDDAPTWTGPIRLTGKSTVGGKPVTRAARNAGVSSIVYNSQTKRSNVRARLTSMLQLQVTSEEVIPVAFAPKENKVYEQSRFGQLKVPFTVKHDSGFKGIDKKVKLLGHSVLSKFKDVTFAKNKDEATLDLNLNTYKLPEGEHVLYLRTQVKGKYSRVTKAQTDATAAEQKKADAAAVEADKVAKAAAAELVALNKNKEVATAEAKAAGKKKSDEAAARKKTADTAKAAAAKKVKDLAAAAKPKDITATFYSMPFTVNVAAAPIDLEPMAAAQVKQGAKLELTVNLTRKYGFADPVTIGVTLPKGAKGLSVSKLTIAKGQSTGKFTLTATDIATANDLALNLEATLKLQNQTIKVTQPLKLKVIEVKKETKK